MLRALSTRRGDRRYERLVDEPSISLLDAEFKRTTSLPAKAFYPSKKLAPETTFRDSLQRNPTRTKKGSKEKIHPLLNLFDICRKKKATARPEFTRYLEYVKEGGMWDSNSNMPVIYYK